MSMSFEEMKRLARDVAFDPEEYKRKIGEGGNFLCRDETPEPYKTSTSPEEDPRNFNISESLLIGFDYGEGDEACLTVVRRKKDKLEVINTYYGAAAMQIYDMLIHKPTTRYI